MSKLLLYGIIVQCLLLNFLVAAPTEAQEIKTVHEVRVKFEANETSIKDVLSTIESKTNFKFSYYNGVFNPDATIKLRRTNKTVSDVLLQISEETGLSFKQINNNIRIQKSNKLLPSSNKEIEIVIDGIEITGKVISSDDSEGLPGVNVLVEGTSMGTVTDVEGNYTISVPDENAILVFSSVGYVTEKVSVGTQTKIDMVLVPDITALEEIIVVGYGTQKKSDITGSVVSVPKERLSDLPVTNLMHAIQGTAAGLQITQDSSVPGSSGTMQIRGVNSINANNSPFIVLDGVPFFGLTNDINPNDIESIEILKDASAVAIYGTRGANGVILITTKRGKSYEGKPTINYNGYVGFESIANELTPMSPDAYVQKYANFLEANGLAQTAVLPNASEVDNYNAGITHDWMDESTRPGLLNEHNLSISGGTENVQYHVSGSHLNQKGVIEGYQYKKTSFRVNVDAVINKYVKVGTSSFFTENNYDGGRVNFLEAAAMSPYSVPYDENGNYIIYPMEPEQLFLNPMIGLTVDRLDRGRNLTGSAYAEITPIEGLTYRLNASYTYNLGRFSQYTGRQFNDQSGTADVNNTETGNWVIENLITYSKDFDKHHFDITGLYSAQQVDYFKSSAQSKNFINDGLSYYNMSAGTSQSNDSEGNSYSLLSQMARINYSYDSRYLLTLTARRDGYSAFGSNTDKYGLFPSMALGWNVGNESFLEGSSFLDQLKVRFSYGESGNQAIGVNQTATTADAVRYPFDGSVQTGILYSNLGNSNLNWETTTSTNLAVDFAILHSRVMGTLEFYKSKTRDILLRRNLPTTSGYTTIWDNLGEMQNTGFEVTLNTVNIETDNFSWETGINFSTYKNELLELYGDGEDDLGNRWFIGQPVRVIYDYEKIGIWQEGEDVSAEDPVAQPGDIKFKDQDGDGQITSEDRVVLGQRDPKWIGGMTNTFRYKNFHLSVFIQTSQGGMRSNRDLTYADEAGRRNLPADFGYWTPENKDNYWPGLAAYKNYRGYSFSEDYSYVRIKDVKLSYVVPSTFLNKYGIKGLTVYATGRNLYTFTSWFGWDPEMRYYSRGHSDNNGTWRNNYPVVKTFSLGINLAL